MSICVLDGGGLHIAAVFDKSALGESDSWFRGVFGFIDPIHNGH